MYQGCQRFAKQGEDLSVKGCQRALQTSDTNLRFVKGLEPQKICKLRNVNQRGSQYASKAELLLA